MNNKARSKLVLIIRGVLLILLMLLVLAIVAMITTKYSTEHTTNTSATLVESNSMASTSVGMTLEEAEVLMNNTLQSVFQDASQDNYIAKKLKEKVHITALSIEFTGDVYLLDCAVVSLNVAATLEEFFISLESGEEEYSVVVAELENVLATADEVTESFQVQIIKVNDEYVVKFSQEMIDFCNGNVQQLLPWIYEILQRGVD